ncbi:MAG: SigE family RNA polymerase sigma factor [Acidimicrobiaceae bacterium]|nr:SigE family RNA polymerase sigma factor [Acidimicrobiaceae bacterium]MCY4176756.1 SigE family RNA polymerase sigma factor [Acidimicrobiaceae bacterium]MCY4279244.1 SigE family RNA polymerase sigma factor [Acidimicrobiaceae bacterium]
MTATRLHAHGNAANSPATDVAADAADALSVRPGDPGALRASPRLTAFVSDDFQALYTLHYRPMVRLAQALVDTVESAEEVVQQAFVKVYERWRRIDDPKGYLRIAVVNGARSELRKREVRRRVGLRSRRPDPAPESDYLIDALGKLDERRRTALVLRFYGDMSQAEIAEAMRIRQGTVKSLISRGLADLRQVIDR